MDARPICLAGRRWIGDGHSCLVVAEIGQNHNGRVDLAAELVDAAAWAGADAVKFVKRDLACDLSREARSRPYGGPHAFGPTYGEHRAALELPPEAHDHLARRARAHGLLYLATACDIPSAKLLESLPVDAFKIASRDAANLPLLGYLARRGLPLILSTGMSDFDELDRAVGMIRTGGCEFALLQCTSIYPAPVEEIHLRSMAFLSRRYECLVGFSDHSQGILLAPVAVALGATIVEKHLTLDRTARGSDHTSSVEPQEMARLVASIRQVEAALGRADKPVADGARIQRDKLGRSLVTRVPIARGTIVEESMLTLKCPGDGLGWSDRDQVVGRTAQRDLPADEMLRADDIA